MNKKFAEFFCIAVVIVSIIVNLGLVLAQEGGDVDLKQECMKKAQEFQRLLAEKQAEGVDVSEALEIDRQSREAFGSGNPEECLRLIKEAMALLKETTGKIPTKGCTKFPFPSAVNLLVNPGFETGKTEPDIWAKFPFPSANVSYGWDNKISVEGTHSVFVEGKSEIAFGVWKQAVAVIPETVYVLSGYVKFNIPLLDPPSRDRQSHCNLQIVFKDNKDNEIKKVDFPYHAGIRGFAYDFPRELKVRAPTNAVSAEINLVLVGRGKVWFDEIFFGPVPVGDIRGTATINGRAVENAHIVIFGEPWGKKYETLTDKNGKYFLKDVPVASPRYILLADKSGYKTLPAGRVDVKEKDVTVVNFELKPGKNPKDDLRIKFGSMALCKRVSPKQISSDAVIPKEGTGYPPAVRPYLESDEFIESEHPSIKKLAKQILESVPQEKRTCTRDVAYAVFWWMIENIDHDFVYSEGGGRRVPQVPPAEERIIPVNEDFKDVTSGIWQSVTGEGWCWGYDIYDWVYKPSETLKQRGVICIEQSWLITALFRTLNIPARTSLGSNEIWIQSASGNGFWVHMSTTSGRGGYRTTGRRYEGFGGMGPPLFFPVANRPLLHEDCNWDTKRRGLWREIHPFVEEYEYSEKGLNQAINDLEKFKQAGMAPRSIFPPQRPRELPQVDESLFRALPPERLKEISYYVIHYSDITISLLGVEKQRKLDVRFPFISESEVSTYTGHEAYWTNHPECVVKTWVEEVTNPPVEGKEKWFHVEFDLRPLLK